MITELLCAYSTQNYHGNENYHDLASLPARDRHRRRQAGRAPLTPDPLAYPRALPNPRDLLGHRGPELFPVQPRGRVVAERGVAGVGLGQRGRGRPRGHQVAELRELQLRLERVLAGDY